MAKIICLTGGIGSGKTTVAKMFEKHGVPVYISDDRAKLIMEREGIVRRVQAIFNENVVIGGKLDRKKIRQLVFKDQNLLSQLNKIVHPAVALDFENWIDRHKELPFVIKESAILFEMNLQSGCEKIILVTAPLEIRIERVLTRDSAIKEEIVNIVNNQIPDYKKKIFCDFIIKNIDLIDTEKQVLKIIARF